VYKITPEAQALYLPPSPPAEKATAIQYQTRQSGTAQDDQQYQPS
jgi:hypothetical protein